MELIKLPRHTIIVVGMWAKSIIRYGESISCATDPNMSARIKQRFWNSIRLIWGENIEQTLTFHVVTVFNIYEVSIGLPNVHNIPLVNMIDSYRELHM